MKTNCVNKYLRVGLFFLILFLPSGCGLISPVSNNIPESTDQVASGKEKTVSATGTVIPGIKAVLSFKNIATNIKVLAEPGQVVQKGDMLIESDTYRQTMALEEAKAQLANAKSIYDGLLREEFREVRQPEKDAAFERIEASQAAVDLAEANLSAATLQAPFACTVIEIYPNSFENVPAGKPVVLIADINSLLIETKDLDEKDTGKIEIGDKVEIFFDAFPNLTADGEVIDISRKSSAGSGDDFKVVISSSENPKELRWGMSAFVVIEVYSKNKKPGIVPEAEQIKQTEDLVSNVKPDNQTNRSCDNADFVSETIPDGSKFEAGVNFSKIWTFRNIGNCTWDTNYKLVFLDGDIMDGPASMALSEYVAPGDLVSVELDLTAPTLVGQHKGLWQLQNENKEKILTVWVDITVIN